MLYETVLIARQDLSVTQAETLGQNFVGILEAQGGKVLKYEYCGLRPLAYLINKNKKGHYIQLNIDAASAAMTEMERTMRLHEDVMRFLTIRVDAHREGNSPLTMSDDRDGGEEGGRYSRRPMHHNTQDVVAQDVIENEGGEEVHA